jgi:ribonuclease P protein component
MTDEAHLSAEQASPGTPPRLSCALGDGGRPQGPERPSRARPQAPVGIADAPNATGLSEGEGGGPGRLGRVTRRADYLAANSALRAPLPGFVLLVRPRGDGDPLIRVGITVSGKVGGAVVRNRMKRRFRELARALLPECGIAGADHILIGRAGGIERDWDLLKLEFRQGLRRLAGKARAGRDPA